MNASRILRLYASCYVSDSAVANVDLVRTRIFR